MADQTTGSPWPAALQAVTRQPLGQLSPNVTRQTPSAAKALASSPLKRSSLAILDDENGFTYLKKRRVSLSTLPRPVEVHEPAPVAEDAAINFRSAETAEALPPLVSSQAPDEEPRSREQSWDRSSSTERQSFSSLINYDPSSQPGHLASQRTSSKDRLVSPPLGPVTLASTSRAERLRLRLRVAMYKVQTDQVNTPFDYLREHTADGMRESSRAVREAVDQLRDEAREHLQRSKPLPVLFEDDDLERVAGFPTSASSQVRIADLQEPSVRTPRSRVSRMIVTELTSSAVKSNAVASLLELKHAV